MPYHVLLGRAAAVAVAAGLLAQPAFANILASATRAGNFTTTTSVPLPLDTGGATSLSFKTTKANQRVRITYNAECGVLGSSGWGTVVVTVDGVAANPNPGTSFAMCTASSTTTYNWTGSVRQSIAIVPTPGLHSLVITGGPISGATTFWQGDSSTVVDQ